MREQEGDRDEQQGKGTVRQEQDGEPTSQWEAGQRESDAGGTQRIQRTAMHIHT